MGPYKPMRPVTETWPMLFFPIHTTNLHVGSTDYYDNVCYMGSSFMCFTLWPLSGAVQVCMNGFTLAFLIDWGGAAASMMWSVTVAHFCQDGEKFRYVFNQMISIASFLDLMSRTFRPPLWIGRRRLAMAIRGLVPWSHMNLLIMSINASSMCGGIPWALARNCVWPPMIACMMIRFPLRVRCAFSHRFSFILMVSSTSSSVSAAPARLRLKPEPESAPIPAELSHWQSQPQI